MNGANSTTRKINLTLTEDDERAGKVCAHDPTCIVVQQHRVTGRQILTMFECEEGAQLPDGVRIHSCLQGKMR